MIKRVFFQNHKTLNFKFFQNKDDFIVNEEAITFSNKGNFLILKIKKTNMDTWELIETLSKFLGIYSNEIGYAGLKDKNATTTQYISIPKKYSKDIKRFRNKKIEILDNFLHKEKLNIGNLKGNRFKINLHDVSLEELNLIQKLIKQFEKKGIPNYFGYQRFGRDIQENLQKAKQLVEGELIIKDKKLSKMLISAYQSSFFNSWLVQRIKDSKDELLVYDGDIFKDLKKDKLFTAKKINDSILNSYSKKEIVPTGLLPGRKVFRSVDKARLIEEKYDDMYIQEKGYRREAIVYPKNFVCKYNKENKKVSLEFSLPKGSYATVLIENLANKNFH